MVCFGGGAMTGHVGGADYVLVRVRFRLHLCTSLREATTKFI